LYAARAWWGFANASDRHRLEAFLRLNYVKRLMTNYFMS